MKKICICGDTQAGKTTFLKAITEINGYPYFVSDPNWPENRDFYTKGVVATSGYSHLKGTLVVAEGQEYPVEFLDYPGEDFSEGFIRNGIKDEKLSRFMEDCSFLYFFVEPKKVDSAHIGALANTLHYFQTQHKRQGSPIHACLVLTKADTLRAADLPDWSSESVESYVEQRVPGVMNTLHDRADFFRCCAISAKDEKISAENRKEFFVPYFNKENTRRRNHSAMVGIGSIVALALLAFGGFSMYQWEKDRAERGIEPLVFRTEGLMNTYYEACRNLLKQFEEDNYPKVNDDNLDALLVELDGMFDPDKKKDNIKAKFTEKVIAQLLEDLKCKKDIYDSHPTKENMERYEAVAERYRKRSGKDVPEELRINPLLTEIQQIRYITSITAGNELITYTQRRIEAISKLLDTSRSISTEDKIAIAEAMQTTKMLADTGHYTVNVSFKGLSKPHVVAVTLTTSRYTEDESDGIHFDDIERELQYNISISLQWNLSRAIYLSLWKEAFWVGESPDEIAGFHQSYSTCNSIAIYPLCSNQWEAAGWTNDETASGVKFKCFVIGPDGQELTQQRLNNVYWYILGNQYWEKLINQIRNDNN